MVNNINVSLYAGDPPGEGQDREILGGPLYSIDDVLDIVTKHLGRANTLKAWTRKAVIDLQDLKLSLTDVAVLLSTHLSSARYIRSEWCENGKVVTDRKYWVACDAYSIKRTEYNEYAGREMEVEYYFKFGIIGTGKLILIVSCHP